MIKTAPVKKVLYTHGVLMGTPCLVVDTKAEDAQETELNPIFEELFQSPIKTILVKGILEEYPELKTLIQGCVSKGKKVIFQTSASSDIDSIRHIKGLSFSVITTPPTKKENKINPKILTLMQEEDEVVFPIDKLEDYTFARDFLKGKTVTRPTVIFLITENYKNCYRTVGQYLEDVERFYFKSRLIKPMSI